MASEMLFTLQSEKLKDHVLVGFRGKEQISRPYEFEVFFTVPAGTAVKSAVGERASIIADRKTDGFEKWAIHGVLVKMSLVHQYRERALYKALLVPRLWLLRHFWRSFVFTHKKLDGFLQDTLEAGGLSSDEFRFDIDKGARGEEEFVTQYRESHLDFFHRWCEREGLYYYFEHKADAKNEVLVIVEDKGHHEAFPGGGRVRYSPRVGDDASASSETLHHLEADTSWLPKTVTLAEYDYANPSLTLKSDSDVTPKGVGTITEYGYRAFVQKDLKRLTEVKAQAIGCVESTISARGGVLGPRPGYKMAIDDRPEELDEEWLVVEMTHQGSIAGITAETAALTGLSGRSVYSNTIVAVPASVQYRAPQSTTWPRIYGFENAVVCGEATSPYAQIDPDGRYFVRFEFDTSDLPDAKASTRVRMLQPHGGGKEGFHFPLRKGTEVMIAFLGGDCDRPFIAGVVPNAQKPSVVGQRNHTQNIIRTGANNQLVMDDEEGQEFIFLHSPNNKSGFYLGVPGGDHASVFTGEKSRAASFTNPDDATDPAFIGMSIQTTRVSMNHHTDGNAGLSTGGSYHVDIGGTQTWFVYGAANHGYHNTFKHQVGGTTTEIYHGKRTSTEKTGWKDTVESGGLEQKINPWLYQEVDGEGHQHVKTSWHHKVGTENHDEYGSWKTKSKGVWDCTIDGNWNGKFASGSVTIDATSNNLHLHTGATIDIDCPTKIHLKSSAVKIEADTSWFERHSMKHEFYVYKGATGIAKTDHAAIYQSLYGLKIDTTLVKVETYPLRKKTLGVQQKDAATGVGNGLLDLKSTLTQIRNFVLRKQ